MSVVISDAVDSLGAAAKEHFLSGYLDVLLYADNTLIIGTEGAQLQQFLDAAAHAGSLYGMELHWSKFQLIQVNRVYKLRTPGGDEIPAKELMTYLGAATHADGGVKSGLNQKLGAAWGGF